jgi:hypothetical protein
VRIGSDHEIPRSSEVLSSSPTVWMGITPLFTIDLRDLHVATVGN